MTKICLVRHGETDWNAEGRLQGSSDIPLNAAGIRQAELCREHLKLSQWDFIISSPLKRAKQTADIINAEIKVPFIEMSEFSERSYGETEGMTPHERKTLFPDKIYPGQESRASLSKRVMNGIETINQESSGKHILLIAHGAVINSILASLSDGEIGSGKTKLTNACLSHICIEQKQWVIKDYNQNSHLRNV